MGSTAEATAPPASVRRSRRPYVDPPPPLQLVTIEQFESEHPALKGRIRDWIKRADASNVEYVGFRRAIVRVARSVMINRLAANEWIAQRSAMPPAPPRNQAPAPAPKARKRTRMPA